MSSRNHVILLSKDIKTDANRLQVAYTMGLKLSNTMFTAFHFVQTAYLINYVLSKRNKHDISFVPKIEEELKKKTKLNLQNMLRLYPCNLSDM